MQGIRISVNNVGARLDIAFITIIGYVDTTTCQELARVIQDLIQQKRCLMIADLGGVTYISSAGWGVFVGEIKNIRDRGGDLKIVQMSPEVFEVFEMLEFNKILNYYDSIEEAIDEFDIIRGIEITRVEESVRADVKNPGVEPPRQRPPIATVKQQRRTGSSASAPTIPPKDLPLMEKIKVAVIEDPFSGARSLCRRLRQEKYGHVRIGWLRMRSILKKLNLGTKEKRYRFYRSR